MTMDTSIADSVRIALQEDIGSGDITAGLIDEAKVCNATIISRQSAIICGAQWVEEVFHQLDQRIELHWQVNDGDTVNADQLICELNGPARALLAGERTALNFLQTLSGTATRAGIMPMLYRVPAPRCWILARPFPDYARHKSMPYVVVGVLTTGWGYMTRS